ncbi:MarR family winged helix-turn-helix transcriptional regulator [Arthrobacter rhombi]|uniref:Transcriptional regulator, MarR family n=1 Tax=Arthrobacter rhombi TaxID=71253 RepID=A0A1R4GTS5_9MICC|nr:MarR family winged helix-turn-helix transcriptional regulator [Arthrobacter rhombi]SJM71491.1 Transcriptional regulator, MarR family [Arthrobacter rhombi]
MTEDTDALQEMQYELMLFFRYQLRPHHKSSPALERSAYVLLNRLERSDPMTLKELSQALRLDASTIHRQVGALIRHEHVAYVPGVAGEVARRIAPTEAGIEALLETRRSYEQGLRDVVADWPQEKQRAFSGLLRDFNENVERIEEAPWPRGR